MIRFKEFITLCLTTSFFSLSISVAEPYSVNGRVYRVDSDNKQFGLLKETEYDPKSKEGASSLLCQWTEKTQFFIATESQDFSKIKAPQYANFHPSNDRHAATMASAKPFSTRRVSFEKGLNKLVGLSKDKKSFVALFTPNPQDKKSGSIVVNGKTVKISLRPKKEIITFQSCSPSELNEGLWKASLKGEKQGGMIVCSSIALTKVPDPRLSDDPNLPRVLVIGDSISMNYHQAAKSALSGVANYHRIEGNGGPSNRGVNCVNLWLGDYTTPGLHWDIIQFNHGLHDLKQQFLGTAEGWGAHQVPLEHYKKNLGIIIAHLKKTRAQLIWCSTTPVPNSGKGPYARRKGESAKYNAAALEIIKKHPEIQVTDLHPKILKSPVFDNWKKGTDVHFYSKMERDFIANEVAKTIKHIISKN